MCLEKIMQHAQYVTILVIAVNSTWFQNFTELHALIHSYALLHLHMCFVEWVLVISFLAQMHWKDWKQNSVYISKVSKWFNLSREWLCTCSHKTTVFDTSSLRTVNCTRFQNFTELHVLTLAVRSYALFYALLIVEISNHDLAHITTKQQSLTLFSLRTAVLTRSSWDIPPSEELPPFSLRKALPTRNTLARRRGSVCTWGPNWRSISITWLEERWENREHCWRFSKAPGGREGRGTPLAARGE